MKRLFTILSLILITTFLFASCGSKPASNSSSEGTNEKSKKLVVGASPVPHSEILNIVKPLLQKKGIELEIKEFTDYVTPNTALDDKQLDANFFQHKPYMEEFSKEKGIELVEACKVHIEPMGAYSKKIKSISEIKDGAKIAIPNDATNEGRALLLLQKQGLIKLKDPTGLTQTPRDIAENPKHLNITELEAAQLPRVLDDVDFAIINTNFALEGNLNPTKDSIFMEDKNSPYANILTVRPDNKDNENIKELVKALNSPEVKKFLEDKYKGEIVPAF